ncbi:MAG TPA: family 16 glycoside hydrolase [Ktedonobacteraceae bacterium]|nr:family 16 glycoside hydrolase [Ktedonobacteraceae bacterium]
MSSAYPPFGGMQTLPCQRCRAPLPINDPYCRNCGYTNAPFPVQNSFPAPSPAGNTNYNGEQPAAPAAFAPQPGAPSTGPMGQTPFGMFPYNTPLARPMDQPPSSLSALPGQRAYPPFGAPSTGPMAPQPFAASASGALPQQAYGAPSTGPMGQFAFNPSPAIPGQPGMSLPGIPAGPSGLDFKESSSRRPRLWLIALAVLLLLIIIGGSFAGYAFLNRHNATKVTPTQVATVVQPKGPSLFADTFKNNSKGWNLQSYPGKFSIGLAVGSLTLEDDNNELLWELVPGNKTFSNFTLTVDSTLSKGDQNNGYGIYIRGSSMQNTDLATYYRFELYGDGSYAVFKGTVDAKGNTNSTKLVDYTLVPAIQKQGGLNHVMITAKGPSMSLTVNGQHLTTVTDNNYSSGSIAFFVSNLQNTKPGAQAKFSNLHIYGA